MGQDQPPPGNEERDPQDVLQVWRPTANPDVFEDVRIKRHTHLSEDLSASAYDTGRLQRRESDPGPRRKG